MDIECVQVLKTLRAGKDTIQPGIYHAPLDRILIDEVRAGGRSVVVIDSKQVASAASTTAAPVSAFKNEIKRLNVVCEGLKAANEVLKTDLKKETEALESCSETYVESVSQYKKLEADNEDLKKAAEEATEAFESLSVSFESLEVSHKELHTENEDLKNKNETLRGELEINEDNVKKLLDEKDSISEKRPIKKGKK